MVCRVLAQDGAFNALPGIHQRCRHPITTPRFIEVYELRR